MATAKTATTAQPVTASTPWGDVEILDGYDLRDKAELVGFPMLIERIWFRTNDKGVSFVHVQAQDKNGTKFEFSDASTGVRAQLVDYLNARGKGDLVNSQGETYDMRLAVLNGLRVSEYEREDPENPRRTIKARTYYLTKGNQ